MTSVEVAELWKFINESSGKIIRTDSILQASNFDLVETIVVEWIFPCQRKARISKSKIKPLILNSHVFLKAPRRVFPKELLPNSSFHVIYITPPTSFTLCVTYIIYIYCTCITFIIYISRIPPTSSTYMHHVHQLQWTASTSHTSSTSTSSTSSQRLHISHKTSKMSFAHELIHRSSYTGVLTQVVAQDTVVCYTGVVIQQLFHRSFYTGVTF